MPVATDTTINGEIVSQDVDGTIHDYLPDPLGHTIGLINEDQEVEFEYDYWPYEEIPTTSDVVTPFRYGGTWGYYSDTFGRPCPRNS